MLNVDKNYQVKVTGKTLALPKHGDIIINSMSQKREK